MNRSEEIQLLEELLGLKQNNQLFLDQKPTFSSVANYTGPSRFRAELETIFLNTPTIIAHTSELPNKHDFLRRTINKKPLLLLRGDDNKVRVFLNVCRHRGTRLVDKQRGCKQRHSCPYHAWTWNSRGEFINGPHFDAGFPNLDRSELNLHSVNCVERHGFIWLLPADATEDIEHFLGAIDSELAWLGIEHLEVHRSEVQQRNCNWKLLVEGGLEAYHFRIAHRNTIGSLFNDNLSSYQCFGPHIRSILPRSTISELREQPRDQWNIREQANMVFNVFPSSSLLIQSDHIIWISINPLSIDQSEIRIMTLKPAISNQSQSYWDKNHELTLATLNEDFELGESIQSGLLSCANNELQFGRFEGALHRFNETVKSFTGAS